ncbi:phosphoribosyltransferase [Nocardioides sp. CPCC 206347]|uniref:phosphoribosyltransferase n=1 Tax=Nocardioides sp. CPCC 206347 TaxID=3406463 RepID=UPI003B42C17A
MTTFADRYDAGQRLVPVLEDRHERDQVILGLPCGGVPVAFEIARALHAPLDVIVVRKLGVPRQPEYAMGAIGEGGVRVFDPDVVARAGVSEGVAREVERRERNVLEARIESLRRGRPRVSLRGRVALIVDDGIATGSTAHAACLVARDQGAVHVVVVSPAAPAGITADDLTADELICHEMPWAFGAVGNFYRDFSPTTDEEVRTLLDAATW